MTLARTLVCTALLLAALAGPAIAATEPTLTAIQAARPREFAEPVDFHGYATKLADWLVAWHAKLPGPRVLVRARQAELAEKVAAWGGEVVAAKARITEVEGAHAAPVASARGDVAYRRDRLIEALVPGRRDAAQHAETARAAANGALSAMQQAEAATSGITAQNVEDRKATFDAALRSARSSAGSARDAASEARDAIARDGDAATAERAMRDLSDAVLALNGHERRRDAALAQPQAALVRAQQALDQRTEAWRTRLAQAERDLRALEQPYLEARSELTALGGAIGTLQHLNWKVFKGFDAHAFLDQQIRRSADH